MVLGRWAVGPGSAFAEAAVTQAGLGRIAYHASSNPGRPSRVVRPRPRCGVAGLRSFYRTEGVMGNKTIHSRLDPDSPFTHSLGLPPRCGAMG